jgi:hypothetical protein
MASVPAVKAAISKRAEWNFWRGSPELLAQVARTALRVTSRDGDPAPQCMIDVEVADDHEIFTSPSDFVKDVTRQALRAFKSIRVDAKGVASHAAVTWRRRRPWWKPGHGKDATVVLEVYGSDEAWAEQALAAIRASIRRGGTAKGDPQAVVQAVIAITVSFLVVGVITAAVASGLYLLKVHSAVIEFTAVGVGVVGLLADAVVLGTWVFRSLEVAPAGQSHLSRAVKFLGPIVITLIVTGLGKLLFH